MFFFFLRLLDAESLVEATNFLTEQLTRIMELDEFKKDISKKMTSMEKRLDRKYLAMSLI